jgi:large repetitive protein
VTAATQVAFQIDNHPPVLAVTSPTTGAYIMGNVTIVEKATDTFLASVQYQVDASGWININTAWNTRLVADGTHTLSVRATDLSGKNATVTFSVIVDNTPPTCRIDNPTAGQYASGVVTYRVKATDAVGIDTVYLKLTNVDTSAQVFNVSLAYSTADGYYQVSTDTTLLSDGNYTMVSWAKDLSGKVTAATPVSFHIDNNAPVLLVTYPTTNAYVMGKVTVTDKATDTFLASVQYKVDNSAWSNMSVQWDTTLLSDGTHTLTVRAIDLSGKNSTVTFSVIVDNTPPTCRIDDPILGQYRSGNVIVLVKATDAVGIGNVNLNLRDLDTSATVFNVSMAYNIATGYYEYTADSQMFADGNYTMFSWATDLSGKITGAKSVSFKIDNNPPNLVVVSPATDAYVSGNVTIDAKVSDTFLNYTRYKVDTSGWVDLSTPWDTTLVPDGNHILTVLAADKSGKTSEVVVLLTVDNTAPTCRIDSPTTGQFVSATPVFKVKASDAVGINTVYLKLTNVDSFKVVFNLSLTYNAASGYYEVSPDTNLLADGNYTLLSWSTDLSGKTTAANFVKFKIDNTPPVLVVESPTTGSYVSGTVTIKTRVIDTFPGLTQYKVDSGGWINVTTEWDTLLLSDGQHTLTVKTSDLSGKVQTETFAVIVDNTPPTSRIDQPAEDQFVMGSLVFMVKATDSVGVGSVYLELVNKDTSTRVFNTSMIYNSATGYYELTYTTTLAPDGNYTLYAWSTDLSGKTTPATLVTFMIDNHAPTLVVTSPATGNYLTGKVPIKTIATDTFLDKTEYKVGSGAWVSIGTLWDTTGVSDGSHTITIQTMDRSGKSETQTLTVIVDNSVPTIKIISPTATEKLHGTVHVTLSVVQGQGLKVVTGGTSSAQNELTKGSDGLYSFDIDTKALGITEGQLVLTAHSENLVGASANATLTVNVYNKAPTISVTNGHKDEIVLTAKFSGSTKVATAYYRVDSGQWIEMSKIDDTTYTAQWNTGVKNNGNHNVEVKVVDELGNEGRQSFAVKVNNPASNTPFYLALLFIILLVVGVLVLLIFLNRRKSTPVSELRPASTKPKRVKK